MAQVCNDVLAVSKVNTKKCAFIIMIAIMCRTCLCYKVCSLISTIAYLKRSNVSLTTIMFMLVFLTPHSTSRGFPVNVQLPYCNKRLTCTKVK